MTYEDLPEYPRPAGLGPNASWTGWYLVDSVSRTPSWVNSLRYANAEGYGFTVNVVLERDDFDRPRDEFDQFLDMKREAAEAYTRDQVPREVTR